MTNPWPIPGTALANVLTPMPVIDEPSAKLCPLPAGISPIEAMPSEARLTICPSTITLNSENRASPASSIPLWLVSNTCLSASKSPLAVTSH